MHNFLLEKDAYPHIYNWIKILSGLITVVGAILLVDYYQPPIINYDAVLDTQVEVSAAGRVAYLITTNNGQLAVSKNDYQQIIPGMTVERHVSTWFAISIGTKLIPPNGEALWIGPNNIYTLAAFFPKLLLASIFTLVFRSPAYWMVSITLLDVIILLVFSGLPFLVIFLSGFVIALILFVLSLIQSQRSSP